MNLTPTGSGDPGTDPLRHLGTGWSDVHSQPAGFGRLAFGQEVHMITALEAGRQASGTSPEPDPIEPDEDPVCANCGGAISADDQVCPHCGINLVSG